MKIQTRQSVFETNSSSMHSLIVMDKDRVEGRPYESTLRLTPTEAQKIYRHANIDADDDCYFGRHPFKILSDFISKWKYAYANFQDYDYCRTHIPSKEVDDLVEIYHKYFSNTIWSHYAGANWWQCFCCFKVIFVFII